jgi:hypothetical protein
MRGTGRDGEASKILEPGWNRAITLNHRKTYVVETEDLRQMLVAASKSSTDVLIYPHPHA